MGLLRLGVAIGQARLMIKEEGSVLVTKAAAAGVWRSETGGLSLSLFSCWRGCGTTFKITVETHRLLQAIHPMCICSKGKIR